MTSATMRPCASCGGRFTAADLLFSDHGQVCDQCFSDAEVPDVGRLLRRDYLFTAVGFIGLGTVLVLVGVGLTVWSFLQAADNPFIDSWTLMAAPIGFGIAALVVGFGSLGRLALSAMRA